MVTLVVAVAVATFAAVRYLPRSVPDAASSALGTPTAAAGPTPTVSPTPPPLPPLRFRFAPLKLPIEGFLGWAVMDRRTGEIFGSVMTTTTWPASMIKAWLAADDLRRLTEAGRTPTQARLRELEKMIRDSDNAAAQAAYLRNGGIESIKRLITMCGLTDTEASPKGWSFTSISARDTVRMADCIADGTAAGPEWTDWLLEMMRTVRIGDFGIRQALPADEAKDVAIKNGWLFYDDDRQWHINCMAVTETWAMAVLQRYPGHGRWDSDFAYGQRTCRDVAQQLLNPDYAG